MPRCSNTTGCQPPRRGFALWVVAMLVVVLLSALPSGGQARSRLVGSAFDPTTVSVALSPKQPKAKASLESSYRQRLPDTTSGEPAPLYPASVSAAAPGGQAETGPGLSGRSITAVPRSLTRAHGPRAPPGV
jgi:hypothetical protein